MSVFAGTALVLAAPIARRHEHRRGRTQRPLVRDQHVVGAPAILHVLVEVDDGLALRGSGGHPRAERGGADEQRGLAEEIPARRRG